ncbi:MAG: hypothetical protein AB7D19_07700 [Acetobacter sp.]|uniref:hypothetical protein n=1 Tax=Acetobacter sp. TaxID=440 RepID=UPI003D02B581
MKKHRSANNSQRAGGRGQSSDYDVWRRAAFHYGRMAKSDHRPGIRIWAAERAAECADRANKADGT